MKCPYCNAETKEETMTEDGVEYPIWACTKNPHHWGSR